MEFDFQQAYRLMYLIRRTEEEIVTRYSRDQQMRFHRPTDGRTPLSPDLRRERRAGREKYQPPAYRHPGQGLGDYADT